MLCEMAEIMLIESSRRVCLRRNFAQLFEMLPFKNDKPV